MSIFGSCQPLHFRAAMGPSSASLIGRRDPTIWPSLAAEHLSGLPLQVIDKLVYDVHGVDDRRADETIVARMGTIRG